MTETEKLLAIEEIKQVFARRLRYMDCKQWDLYGSVHTEDAWSETYGDLPAALQPQAGGVRNKVVGPQALAAAIRHFMEHRTPITSVHHAHTPEIEFISDTTATGIWPMEDHLWWRDGAHEEHLHGYGHYLEHYRKVEGRWLICYRKLTRLRVDRTPGFYDRLA
ncbi:nuclear transport factor 2 family protein [Solimonas flava]|uniref:nuclear transport factor 2 family protein n=1 Tax=Solimonas flava TaxID=415849 RepID=UPI0003FB8D9B|nr:nuclear transport factor 2 family protein [Solimonas flava]